jgi:hypothetical protein
MKNKTKRNIRDINLRRHPYNGIITEIATEQGTSKANITQAIRKIGNPRILEILQQKIIQREENYKSIQTIDN